MQIWPPSLPAYLTRLRIIWLVVSCLVATFGLTGFLLDRSDLVFRPSPAPFEEVDNATASEASPLEPVVVVASQQGDEVTWLDKFDHWPKATYVTDDNSAALTVPKNKGREGMVYLTYIIDHYDRLPPIMIFLHSHRYQWHNDDPLYDGQAVLARLNLAYVMSQGYVSLRSLAPAHFYKDAFEHLFPNIDVPDIVAAPCCAQFAVTAEQVWHRPKADYERIRDWLLDTPLNDSLSGRILEYMWHIIFGQEAISCSPAGECYCKLFGLCHLDCESSGTCGAAYTLPKYSTMPDGWPDFDMDGNWQNATEIRLKFEAGNRGAVLGDRT